MAWRPITADQILNRLSPQESSSLADAQGLTTVTAKLHERIGDEVEKWRGAIIANGVTLGPPETVPDQFRNYIMAIARWEWLVDFPAAAYLQTEARRKERDDGHRMFEALLKRDAGAVEAAPTVDSSGKNWNANRRLIMRTEPVPDPDVQLQNHESFYANP